MLFKWFNASKAVELGATLAERCGSTEPISSSTPSPRKNGAGEPGKQLRAFLQLVDREARPLQLSLYGRSRLAHSFKWRLLEKGVAPETAAELTQILVLRLSTDPAVAASPEAPAATSAIRTNPRKADALVARANEHLARGAYAEAIGAYGQAIELNPRDHIARNNLGSALCRQGRYHEAEEQFRSAARLKPRWFDGHYNLGTVLLWRGQLIEAEAPLRRALKLSPGNIHGQMGLAKTLFLQGRLREAKEWYAKALKTAPASVDAWVGQGHIAAFEGRLDEALSLFKRASEAEPKSPGAWSALIGLRKITSPDVAWLKTAEQIAGSGLLPLEEATIRFAIGKYHDDLGKFAAAFHSFHKANELQKLATSRYDGDKRAAFVDDMIRLYSREALARDRTGSSDSVTPVLVVGMMRSGTSLVEQIIASHPAAFGAGELPFWNDFFRKHHDTVRYELLNEHMRRKLSQAYLATLARHSSDALRVVDKSTFNSDYLGTIHSVFPNARVIYLRRDPIDTCLSCYFQQLSAELNFTMDLSDLAHYYREHHRLMMHWRAVLPPGTLLEVPYAELVSEQEKWTRKIVDFLGLEWDARCLDFHQTKRTVLTASYLQVRQRMYKSSVERWRNYEKFIGPLLALKELRV